MTRTSRVTLNLAATFLSWDLTLNNVPIAYPSDTPAVMQMQAGEKQLWRV